MNGRRARHLSSLTSLAVGAVLSVAATSNGSAAATGTVSIVAVSGAVPATSCAISGATTGQLAIDPSNPNHEVATWETGTGTAEVMGESTNGGASWIRHVLPGVT